MGLMDLFRRKPLEARAAQPGYTAALMAAREAWIAGGSGLAELTAAVQASVSLWESGLSLADVTGADLLDRRVMAICARALALRGECIFLIRDRLIPATDWDMSTRHRVPRAYRLGLPEIGGGRSETVLAAEAAEGTRRLAIAAPGFSADCLETLEELAIRGREVFFAAGGTQFAALECLNARPVGMAMLEGIVRRELAGWL